jgi:hypothetical protein
MITLDDLIFELQDLRDDVGGDAVVRVAHQPQWAFEYDVDSVAHVAAKRERKNRPASPAVVYLAEGRQVGYLQGDAAVAVGWSEAKEDDKDECDGSPDCGCDECNAVAAGSGVEGDR